MPLLLGSEEHTSESSHLGISYAVFCLKKKKTNLNSTHFGSHYRLSCLYYDDRLLADDVGAADLPSARTSKPPLFVVRVVFFFLNKGRPPEFTPFPLPAPFRS